jgi:hypothetical protein
MATTNGSRSGSLLRKASIIGFGVRTLMRDIVRGIYSDRPRDQRVSFGLARPEPEDELGRPRDPRGFRILHPSRAIADHMDCPADSPRCGDGSTRHPDMSHRGRCGRRMLRKQVTRGLNLTRRFPQETARHEDATGSTKVPGHGPNPSFCAPHRLPLDVTLDERKDRAA